MDSKNLAGKSLVNNITEESKKNISDGIKKSEIFLISMKSKERIEKIKNTKKKNLMF